MMSCSADEFVSTYTYGSDGLRRSTAVNDGTPTRYILDGQNVAKEWDDSNNDGNIDSNECITYLTGPRGLECEVNKNGVRRWFLYDGLGSAISTIDDNGNLGSAQACSAFGELIGGGGLTVSAHLSATRKTPFTDLIYMRARYYDPGIGSLYRRIREGTGRTGICTVGTIRSSM